MRLLKTAPLRTHHQNLLAVGDRKVLWLILVAVSMNRLCSLLPESIYFDPFPAYDLQITLQTYVYFITSHLSIILIWLALWRRSDNLSKIFYNFMVIEIFSLVDFLVIYEHPIFHLGTYGVEFTDIKIILYSIFIIKWNLRH